MPYRELYWAVALNMLNAAVPNVISQKRLRDTQGVPKFLSTFQVLISADL